MTGEIMEAVARFKVGDLVQVKAQHSILQDAVGEITELRSSNGRTCECQIEIVSGLKPVWVLEHALDLLPNDGTNNPEILQKCCNARETFLNRKFPM
jgi:hypothetical protein